MIYRYLKPRVSRIILQVIIKLSGTIVELLIPSILSTILDDYAPIGNLHGVYLYGAFMIGCAVLAWIGNITANKMATRISRDFIVDVRRDLYARMSTLSAHQRDILTEASINSRLTSDTYNLHAMVDRMQRLGIRAPIMLIGGILVALMLDVRLTLVMLCAMPFLAMIVYISSKKGVPLYTRVQEGNDHMVRKIQESMTGARIIRALSRGEMEREAFEGINTDLSKRQQKADLTMAFVSPLVNLVLNIGLAFVILVGAFSVSRGTTQPGTIIAFLSYFTIILNSLIMISRIFVICSKGMASARRIEEVLNLPEDLKPVDMPGDSRSSAHLAFEDVSFSYHGAIPALSHISFHLEKGKTLGIIGPTGSGKSTLLSLILRMYDPDQGRILLSGADLRSLSKEEIHNNIGVVFQNDFLMKDTLRENIRFGRDLNDPDLLRATDTAQANFVQDIGLDHPLAVKGHNLSGGQQQRVLVSRALAGTPELLLLDDCSSALDYRTDRELRHALRRDLKDTTLVLISQRVSSVMACDDILVMEKGRIIGHGTHAELMKSCTAYRDLCRLQLGGDAA
ncbi:MAG: ABC transporter ATP-binding protein/permease [Clostridiales bacterium]|nr:ABC transporter ATP-binding protein/permease [Clostridiales bacterium]